MEAQPMPNDEVEEKKRRMEMYDNLRFVEDNIGAYEAKVEAFLNRMPIPFCRQWAEDLKFPKVKRDNTLQIAPEQTRELFSRLPEELVAKSKLKIINYEDQDKVLFPSFDDHGQWKVGIIPLQEFPGTLHPHRVFVGWTSEDGTVIKPTALPPTLSKNRRAVELYQMHVMIHEFLHTVLNSRRSEDRARRLVLEWDDAPSQTLWGWMQAFQDSHTVEPGYTSHYAQARGAEVFLHPGVLRAGVTPTDDGMQEQINEAFVAYLFDIISNPHGYTSFQTHRFGNPQPQAEVLKHGGWSIRYGLMKRFCSARFREEPIEVQPL